MLASVQDVVAYTGPGVLPFGRRLTELHDAERWVSERVHGLWPENFPPLAVREATALLAAIFLCDPEAVVDESRVPNMVRLMLLPYC